MTNLYVFKTNKKNIAYLYFNQKKVMCYVGSNGIGRKVREGDKITPIGTYIFLEVYYRPDKNKKFKTTLPIKKITKNSYWCVDPKSPFYNETRTKLRNNQFEKLYRDDCLYDILIVINFNIKPKKAYKGSAIFIHCIDNKTSFTEGCIALKKKDICKLLEIIGPTSKLIIR